MDDTEKPDISTIVNDPNIRTLSEPKDLKTSIRNKYKRRLRILAQSLDDFVHHAELRLDATKAGRIHKRNETEELLEACKSLRKAIPVQDDGEIDERVFKNLSDFFGMTYDSPEVRAKALSMSDAQQPIQAETERRDSP